MIIHFINQYNSKHGNILNCNMLNLGNQNAYTYLPFKFNIQINRQAIQNSSDKYIEEIKWGSGNNMAVAIGLNPSQALPNNLDKTNELLVYMLYNLGQYDGFYLINLYSFIQTKGFQKYNQNDQIDIIVDTINSYSQTNKLISIDVYMFFGRSFYINSKQLNNLNRLKNVNVFTIGNSNCAHHHPGRGVSCNNIKATQRNYPLQLTNNHLI